MASLNKVCPICGEGQLQDFVEKNRVEYNGRSVLLDSHYSVCNACGSEQANAAQIRQNKRLMVAFKKQEDGLLTGSKVRAIREMLGITQSDAARVFGGGPVAFSKYESDDVTQSDAMDKLLRVAAEVPDALGYLMQRAGVSCNQKNTWSIDAPIEQKSTSSNKPVLRVVTSKRPTGSVESWKAVS